MGAHARRPPVFVSGSGRRTVVVRLALSGVALALLAGVGMAVFSGLSGVELPAIDAHSRARPPGAAMPQPARPDLSADSGRRAPTDRPSGPPILGPSAAEPSASGPRVSGTPAAATAAVIDEPDGVRAALAGRQAPASAASSDSGGPVAVTSPSTTGEPPPSASATPSAAVAEPTAPGRGRVEPPGLAKGAASRHPGQGADKPHGSAAAPSGRPVAQP